MTAVKNMINNKQKHKKNETDIVLIIKCKDGRVLGNLSQFSGREKGRPNQFEVLIDKGHKFRFTGYYFDNNTPVFRLDEI